MVFQVTIFALIRSGDMTNPYAIKAGSGYWVAFQTDRKVLYWNGEGFKDMAIPERRPMSFVSLEVAETCIKNEFIPFIHKWRADQVDLIKGW